MSIQLLAGLPVDVVETQKHYCFHLGHHKKFAVPDPHTNLTPSLLWQLCSWEYVQLDRLDANLEQLKSSIENEPNRGIDISVS